MFEVCNLLDCNLTPTWPVYGRADDAVCTFSDDIEDLVICTCEKDVSALSLDYRAVSVSCESVKDDLARHGQACRTTQREVVLTDIEAHLPGCGRSLCRCMRVLRLCLRCRGCWLGLFGHVSLHCRGGRVR